ncbi:hypothetical protein BRC89_10555 [Halobacteriales archaeon QS_4_70_19]|nr:MAG: hypothetical protein BRC89_10555 [Halobacteriales archaeon QS_4_70_19]
MSDDDRSGVPGEPGAPHDADAEAGDGPPGGSIPDRLLIGDVLSGAVRRLVRPAGLLLLGAYLLVGFAGAVATTTLFAAVFPRLRTFLVENAAVSAADLPPTDPSPLALSVDPSTAVGMVLVTALLAETLHVVAIRVFARDARAFPREALHDLAPRAVASFLANSLAAVAIFAGLVAFLLPGILLAIAFYLVRAVVAIEGAGVVAALRRSWQLVAGHRVRVLLLLLVVVLVGQVATLPGSVAEATALGAFTAAVVGVVLGAVVTAFGSAVAARAYVQLAGIDAAATVEAGGDGTGEDGDDDEEPLGALTPEEIDERFDD